MLGLLQPKQEPGSAGQATGPAAATGSRRAGGAKGKKAAAADAALDGLPPVRGIVKKEEEAEGGTQAGALNASAQAVVEVPLVAGSGDAAADGVALPGWPALSDGDPGGGSQGAGNFKRFRKQGQQLPPSQVEPLGVVPVEAFKEDEQTAEFLRCGAHGGRVAVVEGGERKSPARCGRLGGGLEGRCGGPPGGCLCVLASAQHLHSRPPGVRVSTATLLASLLPCVSDLPDSSL